MKVIGLTGGIGSGKTTVAAMLADLGALVLHADLIGHEVYAPGTAGWQQVTAAFGTDIVDATGAIDRRKLGAVVFANAAALDRLNAIVHPLIYAEVERRLQDLRASGRRLPVVLEAAILIEAGWLPLVEEVWLVLAGEDAVVERLGAARQLTPADVRRRLQAQLRNDQRRQYADVIIENTGSQEALRRRVDELWGRLAVSP